jgi:LDH2 family malate/lactate/ureidoglycolate dehydrogenase
VSQHAPEEATLRVVVITGAPAVGKTEVARRLVGRYRLPSAVVDTDSLADVRPWSADDRLYRLMAMNLRACLPGYREAGVEVLVVSGVLVPGRALDHFADLIASPDLEWVFYGLRAGRAELAARAYNDAKEQDAATRIMWSHIDEETGHIPGVCLIDTTDLSVVEVVDLVARCESEQAVAVDCIASGQRIPAEVVQVPVGDATQRSAAALESGGFPPDRAATVVEDLLAAEFAGVPSHGLIRIPEYVDAVTAGEICPAAEPSVTRHGNAVMVDGQRAPGAILSRQLAEVIIGTVRKEGFALVGLRQGSHVGQLRPLGTRVADAGHVLFGFLNFSGAGQKVAPPGAIQARLATNPIVFACPAPPGPPVVVDMSTSATAEGAIRIAHLTAMPVTPGLLQDARGRWVRDPGALYSHPPAASLAPLGGVAAHKGYALSLMAEILAGMVAGGGFVGPVPAAPGNAGLFVAFPAAALGRSPMDIGADVLALEKYLASCPTSQDTPPRLPGRAVSKVNRSHSTVAVPATLWRHICSLGTAAAEESGTTKCAMRPTSDEE